MSGGGARTHIQGRCPQTRLCYLLCLDWQPVILSKLTCILSRDNRAATWAPGTSRLLTKWGILGSWAGTAMGQSLHPRGKKTPSGNTHTHTPCHHRDPWTQGQSLGNLRLHSRSLGRKGSDRSPFLAPTINVSPTLLGQEEPGWIFCNYLTLIQLSRMWVVCSGVNSISHNKR